MSIPRKITEEITRAIVFNKNVLNLFTITTLNYLFKVYV